MPHTSKKREPMKQRVRRRFPWKKIIPLMVVVIIVISILYYVNSSNSSASSEFPFPCLGFEGTVIHVHPWLRIVIEGENVTIPANIGIKSNGITACYEPVHTHDTSGVIHVESPNANTQYTLSDFFEIWNDTYGFITLGGVHHPIVFNSTDILGFKADSTHKVVILIDGSPSTIYGSVVLNDLDYCSASSTGPPCSPTAQGDPYWNGQSYPYGTGHTIVIEYTANITL